MATYDEFNTQQQQKLAQQSQLVAPNAAPPPTEMGQPMAQQGAGNAFGVAESEGETAENSMKPLSEGVEAPEAAAAGKSGPGVGEQVAGSAGGALGTAAGAAIGTALLPGIGTAIGASIGGSLGGAGGKAAAGGK